MHREAKIKLAQAADRLDVVALQLGVLLGEFGQRLHCCGRHGRFLKLTGYKRRILQRPAQSDRRRCKDALASEYIGMVPVGTRVLGEVLRNTVEIPLA
nr:hypothetical protein CFP56_69040 [Quercus suber]